VHASRVVVVFEQPQLSFQVVCSPNEQTIQILSAEGRDQPFDKGMGPGNQGHRLHRFHVQDPQIGLPAVELEQRVMISTEPPGPTLPRGGLVEHTAERWTVDGNGLHADGYDFGFGGVAHRKPTP
jgi:hypothetical protein